MGRRRQRERPPLSGRPLGRVARARAARSEREAQARPLAIVLLATLTLAAGCRGGDGTGDGKESATTAAESPTGAFGGKGGAVEDRKRAEDALLRVEDLPPDWASTPHQEAADDPNLERQLAACMGVDPAQVGQTASTVDSPDFHLPGARLEVQSSVGLADTVDKARARLAVFERPEMAACINAVVSEAIRRGSEPPGPSGPARAGDADPQNEPPKDASFGAVATERLSFPAVGDGTVAYRVTMPVQAAGQQVAVYADLVVASKGRAGVRLSFLGLGEPFPADVAEDITRTAVDRLPPT